MPETLNATIQRIRFHNTESGWTVLVAIRDDTHEAVTIVGVFPEVQEGEPIVATGEWRQDRKYGRQFNAETVAIIVPTSREGIERYLAAGHVKGIRAGLAKKLVARFDTDLLRIIDEEPNRLREVAGLGAKTLEKITSSWNEQRSVRALMVFLAQHGLGGGRAFRIQKHYGDNAIAAIRENPYRLAHEVRGIGFKTADAIARGLGYDLSSPFRLLAGLRHVVELARESGHCGIPEDDALTETVKLLGVGEDLVRTAMTTAIEMRVVIVEDLEGRRVLFDPWLHAAESRIAETLAFLSNESPSWGDIDIDAAITTAEAESAIALDPAQRKAIRVALTSKAAVITGGPGVGKTTLVNALVSVLQSAERKVLLAAPTGRAAKRLAESTGMSAVTIHRLLEMSAESNRFQRNEENPLECDVLIIDEASMVDVPLLDAVLRALPRDAAIVLVGDADQLPSIGPGEVLHDILSSERVPSIRLTEIHRQAAGSDIIANAHRINRGEHPRFGLPGQVSDMFLFRTNTAETAVQRVVELVTERIPRQFGLKALRDVQVLAPMRNGSAGVVLLNRELQRAINPPDKHRGARVERPNDVVFAPGDKVMQTENNYEKNVFNGDVGVLAMVDMEEEMFTVDFGADLIVDYSFDEADQLTLAYATTIHKSQGSEYPAVVVVLMPQHSIMLRRNLLYTAVTRGRKLVVIVGDSTAVGTAVRTGHGGERWTRLAQCLIAAGSGFGDEMRRPTAAQ
ncbi:MAG TPA: ATP-dependent RecD-like DNA helicase [Thermoanaerobaculia bacterium]|jgi:exodeoxyribonuclease V alpha subunit|nr:ATP-dependent RecD-like DNA helicase [Thermoanaerobaculia bacterium]